MRSRFGSAFYFFCLRSLQGLFQVGLDIVHILDAHGEAHQVGGHPGGGQLGVAHLAVGGTGGVKQYYIRKRKY